MGIFLKRLILFLIPMALVFTIVIIVDPYNYFFSHNFVPDKVKQKVINLSAESMPRGNTLFKYIEFGRKPEKNVIIGDSRAFDLNVDTIEKITHQKYYNFGVPGGNYKSVIETFWYMTEKTIPEKVYIQVSYHTYNANNNYDLMAEAKEVCKSPYLFFQRFYFFKESIQDLYFTFTGNYERKQEIVTYDSLKWNKTLKIQGESTLINRIYPNSYYEKLKEISEYCAKSNIELHFIIFPDQKDFHDLVVKYSLTEDYKKFKSDIFSLGDVTDFDTPDSPYYADRNNYRDLYHLKLELIDNYIVHSIWKN
jgi:hypothetical protein